jgi:hypothetical protein
LVTILTLSMEGCILNHILVTPNTYIIKHQIHIL